MEQTIDLQIVIVPVVSATDDNPRASTAAAGSSSC